MPTHSPVPRSPEPKLAAILARIVACIGRATEGSAGADANGIDPPAVSRAGVCRRLVGVEDQRPRVVADHDSIQELVLRDLGVTAGIRAWDATVQIRPE